MPKEQKDILLDRDADYELVVADGDFATGEATAQHQESLILDNKGDYKQNPTICVGAFLYLHNDMMNELLDAISEEFTRDGMEVKRLKFNNDGSISSNAFYK